MKIIVASHNLHKIEELIALSDKEIEAELLPEDFPEIPETGTTLEENALQKARFVFQRLQAPVLSDDTGLEVDALGGKPGVYTARYAGEHATYADNCLKLLRELHGKKNRNATFRSVLCFIDQSGSEHFFHGESIGIITEESKGTSGFGYDPVFAPADGGGQTFAQMTGVEKNHLSHRSRAMRRFITYFKKTFPATV